MSTKLVTLSFLLFSLSSQAFGFFNLFFFTFQRYADISGFTSNVVENEGRIEVMTAGMSKSLSLSIQFHFSFYMEDPSLGRTTNIFDRRD